MNIDDDLPKKFRATHAGRRHECWSYFGGGLLLVAISLGIIVTVLPRQIGEPLLGFLTPLWPVLFIGVPSLLVFLNWQHHTNIMNQSWCEFTTEGVEFHNHKGRKYLRWSDVTNVYLGKDALMAQDSPYRFKFYTVEIVFGRDKIVITSEYFSEDDHMEIRRIVKFKAPPTAEKTRYDD